MILAAADYAEGQGPPPDELVLWDEWQYFGLAPEAGGLHDQPAGLLRRIRAALEIVQAVTLYNQEGRQAGQMAAWRAAHPREDRIARAIRKLRQA